MGKAGAREVCGKNLWWAAAVFVLLSGIALLAGCQGVSAGGPSSQQQTTTLSVGSFSLGFGSVAAGTSKTLPLTVSNSGPASVTVSGISISTQYFSVTAPSLPITVAAGQSAPISIKFTPNATGTFNATAAITSDASDTVTDVSLAGTGAAASSGQLAPNPASEIFGDVVVGAQQSQTVTLTNTGGSSVNISQASVSGAGFQLSGIATPLTLNASQSATFTVTFAPQASGNASGAVTITSNGSNPTITMVLSGTGIAAGDLTPSLSSEAFGSVTVGNKQTVSETLTNTGGESVTISQVAISGTGFSLSGITAPVTLTSGQSATFSVTFTPASAGSASGAVTITSNGSNPTLSIPLSGTGTAAIGQLAVTPTTLAEGSVVVGTSSTASGSLTASTASVTVTAVSSNNSAFSVSGLSLPVTIPAGQSTSFTVIFSPQATGAASGTLTFASNAQPSTTTETVTGTGTPAPVHSVALSWTASTSPDIAGYNIYRALYTSSCGSFSMINSGLNASTAYTDSLVTDGTSYCYATTAVNSSNEESGYSNVVSNVQIPAP